MNSNSDSPIGVFDSGVGGISVLESLVEKFPRENFIYLGDTARLPYGTKSAETVRKYAEQSLEFLHKQGVKAFVIACNTASSAFLEKSYKTKPVYNMIECGVREILESSKGKKTLLLATKTTVRSKAYDHSLQASGSKIPFVSIAAPLFIPLVEEGLLDGPVVTEVLQHTLKPIQREISQGELDLCLLGCTHFPFLKKEIQNFLGPQVLVRDSTAQLEALFLQDEKKGLVHLRNSSEVGTLKFVLTDSSEHFQNFIHQRWPQRHIEITQI